MLAASTTQTVKVDETVLEKPSTRQMKKNLNGLKKQQTQPAQIDCKREQQKKMKGKRRCAKLYKNEISPQNKPKGIKKGYRRSFGNGKKRRNDKFRREIIQI